MPQLFLQRPRIDKPGNRQLGLDFHNHLLPGVDDGMADHAEAKAGIAALQEAGFTGAVLTPHIFRGVYDNTPSTLREHFASFAAALDRDGIFFPLRLAAEYFADEYFLEQIESGDLLNLPVAGERWVLVEFPYHREDDYAAICVAALAARGYRPVIAHVERYRYVARGRTVWLNRFARAGAILQADIGSLAGQHGETAQDFAQWLLARGLITLWGSDLHKPMQVRRFIDPGLKHLKALPRLNTALDNILAIATA